MKINEVPNINNLDFLKITDFENFFDVVEKNNIYCYNLNNTIYFDIPKTILKDFTLNSNMHWPLISYLIYGTTRLAWVLLKINNIKIKDIFKIKYASETIKYIPYEYIQNNLIFAINNT